MTRTLQEILQDQAIARQVIAHQVESDFDAIELREIITNPQTLIDMGNIESWSCEGEF